MIKDLKETLENLVYQLLGHTDINMRWVEDYFPFTNPSFEMEICLNGDWIEVLGSGEAIYAFNKRHFTQRSYE